MAFFSAFSDKKIRRQIFAIALPIAIAGLTNQAQVLIDSAFLGRYVMPLADGSILTGKDFFSALGNVFLPYIVSLALIFSLTTGTVVLISQRLGAGDRDRAQAYANASVKFMPLLSILVWLLWLVLARPVLILMGVSEPILSVAMTYFQTMSLELLGLGLLAGMEAVFQGQGITIPAMVAGIIRSLFNVLLDWIFIFGNLGFPEMGVAGAGLATSLSGLLVGAGYAVYFFYYKKVQFRMRVSGVLKAPLRDFVPVVKVGLPTSVEDSLWNLGNLLIARILNGLSPDAVGIYRLVVQIQLTPIYFYGGIARAVTTLVGNRTGERNIPEAKRTAFAGSFFSVSICAVFGALFLIMPRSIISIMNPDPAFTAMVAPFLMITAFTMFPQSFNVVIGAGIRGYGDTRWMLATQIFGIVFVVALAWILIVPAGLGMYGLFLAFAADETVRGIMNTIRFFRGEYSLFHKRPT